MESSRAIVLADSCPEWDPQGKRLAVPVQGELLFGGRWCGFAVVEFPSRRWRHYVFPWERSHGEPYAPTEFCWDPTGRYLLFNYPKAARTTSLWVLDTRTGGVRRLAEITGDRQLSLRSPTCSPNGRWVACLAEYEVGQPRWQIVVCRLSGGKMRKHYPPLFHGRDDAPWCIRWEPGGQQVAWPDVASPTGLRSLRVLGAGARRRRGSARGSTPGVRKQGEVR
ncbi:MAG: hypothetical protein FJX77_06730 [Armatimonadetes bacterium]|nr:hypothetical protein [Armatimonadota bacterium]